MDIVPIADGGEGTLDVLVEAMDGAVMGVIARGPMGIPVRAHLGRLSDGTGVVELAQASGLMLVPDAERDPMKATTYGTGELIKGALARRPHRLVIAIGDSATVDGGMGLARALGMRFLDAEGNELVDGGAGLTRLAKIDNGRLDPRLIPVPMLVAADVAAPIEDAAATFGPQKGATPQMVEELARGLAILAERIEVDLHVPVAGRPGGGAAGGAGAMLMGLGGDVRSGAEIVLEAVGFDQRLRDADLVVTGEGCLDAQTALGKGPAVVARAAASAGVPCVALVGRAEGGTDAFAEVRSILEQLGDQDRAMAEAASTLRGMAARMLSERRFG